MNAIVEDSVLNMAAGMLMGLVRAKVNVPSVIADDPLRESALALVRRCVEDMQKLLAMASN